MGIIGGLINEKNVLEISLGENLLWNATEELNFIYPFDQISTRNIDLTNAITNGSYSFIVDDSLQKLKTNSNYNKANGLCYGYIKLTVPSGKTATISGNLGVSSETNYDIGIMYYSTSVPSTYPTYSQCKATTFSSTIGTRVWYKSGNYTSIDITSFSLTEGTYYLVYGYSKDGSGNSNLDRFFVNNINIKIE